MKSPKIISFCIFPTVFYSLKTKCLWLWMLFAVITLHQTASAGTQIKVGSYTGNGAASQVISGLGFTPVCVLVQVNGSSTSFIATSTMGNKAKVNATGALQSNYITAMASGSFTAGSSANASSTTYYYIAFASTAVAVGTYTGTGSNFTVTLGFQPTMLWSMPASSSYPSNSVMNMKNYSSNIFKMDGSGATGYNEDFIGAYTATTFAVPSYASSSETFHYVAFKLGTLGTYTGNGSSRTITTVASSNPAFVMVKDQGTCLSCTNWYRMTGMPANTSYRFNGASSTTQVTSLTANGFTLGTSGDANTSGSTEQYFQLSASDLLPVTLSNFEAERNDKTIDIKWQTTTEENSSHFELEKSHDGVDFTTIATLVTAGNSSTALNYKYTDKNVSSEQVYYRLKMVDQDQSFNYSNTIFVGKTSSNKLNLSIYPDPIKDNSQLIFDATNDEKAIIEIHNNLGQLVNTFNINVSYGFNNIQLETSELPAGYYTLRLILEDNSSQAIKFIKTNN